MYAGQSALRTAVALNDAFAQFPKDVKLIGTIPEEVQRWKDWHGYDSAYILPVTGKFTQPSHDTEIVKAINALQTGEERKVAQGSIELPFRLKIQHADFQSEGELGADIAVERADWGEAERESSDVEGDERESELPIEGDDEQETASLLAHWYKSLKHAVSNREHIRIPANDLSADPALTAEVQKLWTLFFFHKNIRVVPSALHLYGRGSMGESNVGDCEPDLLGTMLVGLGDNWHHEWDRLLRIQVDDGEIRTHTRLGTWVAFAAGVACTTRVPDWFRTQHAGFISFKIFRDRSHPPATRTETTSDAIAALLSGLRLPCGIFLDKKYVLDAKDLSPFDSQVYKAVQEISDAKLLPVLIDWDVLSEKGDGDTIVKSSVYPLAANHMASLLPQGPRTTSPCVESAATNVDWLANISTHALIPFYTHEFEETTVLWKEVIHKATKYREAGIAPHGVHDQARICAGAFAKGNNLPVEQEAHI
ncbi:hypothetical protein DFH09DRAFT_1317922 [Mycena vulgaris]|nr:hypothetical protein DFH09DRAFT_1317922 [Mycena vulgaris]